jgi:hypothetical protein
MRELATRIHSSWIWTAAFLLLAIPGAAWFGARMADHRVGPQEPQLVLVETGFWLGYRLAPLVVLYGDGEVLYRGDIDDEGLPIWLKTHLSAPERHALVVTARRVTSPTRNCPGGAAADAMVPIVYLNPAGRAFVSGFLGDERHGNGPECQSLWAFVQELRRSLARRHGAPWSSRPLDVAVWENGVGFAGEPIAWPPEWPTLAGAQPSEGSEDIYKLTLPNIESVRETLKSIASLSRDERRPLLIDDRRFAILSIAIPGEGVPPGQYAWGSAIRDSWPKHGGR